MISPDKQWYSVQAAAEEAGVTVGWIRFLLSKYELRWVPEGRCWKVGQRAWAIHASLVKEIKEGTGPRSVGKRDLPKKRKKPRRK